MKCASTSSVLAFGLLIAIVSGVVFGVAPALRASRLDLAQSLMLVGRATADSSRVRLRQTLIAGQIAFATMLLVGAALLLQGFVRLQRVPLGFESDRVLTVRLSLPRSPYADAQRIGQFYERLVNNLKASGAVGFGRRGHERALCAGRPRKLSGAAAWPPVSRRRPPMRSAAEHIVSGDYFRVARDSASSLAVPSTTLDTAGTGGVAIVSQRLARQLWPNTTPLGQIVERAGRSYEVVGVVGDIRGSDLQGPRGGGPDRDPRAAVYFAAGQLPQRTMTLLVRPRGEFHYVSTPPFAMLCASRILGWRCSRSVPCGIGSTRAWPQLDSPPRWQRSSP